jgi:phosphorylated adapter RNA export protein
MSQRDAVANIAEQLGEKDVIPLKQIGQIIEALGEERTMQLLADTLAIEASGGMTVADGSRRRSPGGVFFNLVRKELSREWKQRIFYWQPEGTAKKPAATEPATVKTKRPRIIEVSRDLGMPKTARKGAYPSKPVSKEGARDKIRQALAGLPAGEQRELLLELIADIRPSGD